MCGSATGQTRRSSADAGRLPSHLELPISVNELAQRGVNVRPAARRCGFEPASTIVSSGALGGSPTATRLIFACRLPCDASDGRRRVLTIQRPGAVELRAHSYAPRLDAHRRRRPEELTIARRPRRPRPRLRSTPAVYQAGVLLATPLSEEVRIDR